VSARIIARRPSRRGWWLVVPLAAVGLATFGLVFALGYMAPEGAMSSAAGETVASTAPGQAALPLSPPRADASPTDWRRLSKQVARLQFEVEALQRQLAERPAARSAAEGATSVRPLDGRTPKEAEAARIGEHAAAHEARFQEERVDPAWASTETSALRQALSGAGNDEELLSVRSIDCRTRSCRIEIDGGASNARLQSLMTQVGASLGSMSIMPTGQPGGGTVLYMQR